MWWACEGDAERRRRRLKPKGCGAQSTVVLCTGVGSKAVIPKRGANSRVGLQCFKKRVDKKREGASKKKKSLQRFFCGCVPLQEGRAVGEREDWVVGKEGVQR